MLNRTVDLAVLAAVHLLAGGVIVAQVVTLPAGLAVAYWVRAQQAGVDAAMGTGLAHLAARPALEQAAA